MSVIERAAKRLEQLRQAGIVAQRAVSLGARAGANGQPAAAAQPAAKAPAPQGGQHPSTATRKSPAQCGRHLVINTAALAAAKLLVPDHAPTRTTNEFRNIKQPLLANVDSASGSGPRSRNVVLVTSATPGEGKSFCALNLALSLAAEVDRSAMLLDADVLRPSCAERLGAANDVGLLDILEDSAREPMSVAYSTNIARFSFVPAGKPRSSSAELLTSEQMAKVLHEFAHGDENRVVVIDGPPLLPTTEAKALAHAVGQVVVVVEAGVTPVPVIEEAFRSLEECEIVLCILNKETSGLGYPGSGYGY